MIKYDKKWCLENCPYINGNKKFKWKYYNNMDGINFYIMINDKKFPVCIKLKNGYILQNKSDFLLRMLNEHADMELHAKKCPVYAEMMMKDFNKV